MTDRLPLYITPGAWATISLAIRLCPTEVSGLAIARNRDGHPWIEEVFVLKQVASDVDTRIDPDGLASFLLSFIDAGGDPAALRVWWHSHAREQVFWSTDDEQTIRALAGAPFISVVGNHAGRFLAREDGPNHRTATWLDFVIPGPPPDLDEPEANRVRGLLASLVERRARPTTRPWTDDGPDGPSEHE